MAKKGMSPEKAEEVRLQRGLDKGSKLRVLRVKKGLSQSELCAITGISKKSLQRYEQQHGTIDSARLDTLTDLCLALGCKIEDIIEDKDLIQKYRLTK